MHNAYTIVWHIYFYNNCTLLSSCLHYYIYYRICAQYITKSNNIQGGSKQFELIQYVSTCLLLHKWIYMFLNKWQWWFKMVNTIMLCSLCTNLCLFSVQLKLNKLKIIWFDLFIPPSDPLGFLCKWFVVYSMWPLLIITNL